MKSLALPGFFVSTHCAAAFAVACDKTLSVLGVLEFIFSKDTNWHFSLQWRDLLLLPFGGVAAH